MVQRKDSINLENLELLILCPTPGPKKDAWVIVRETHHVLDQLFPKFLKGTSFRLFCL